MDLLELRAASTVMQDQVLTGDERPWARDARAGLLADIQQRGSVYGQ